MKHSPTDRDASPHPGIGSRAFIGFVAALMAINALSIDIMLPALPDIGRSLEIVEANQRQWVISSYMLGFGVAQLVYGPLSDRHGRRPILMVSLVLFVLTSLAATFASSFEGMMVARVLQGVAAAATRVLAISIVRDCYSGRRMARIMSLSFIVFLAVPILAPSIGQLILLVAPWPWIFAVLGLFGAAVLVWTALRLPETLHPEYRRPMSLRIVLQGARKVLGTRASLGYNLASTLMFGSLLGFINSSQQIFATTFGAPHLFTTIFAAAASAMAVASYVNSRIVERLGSRRISHGALIGFIAVALIHLAIALSGHETIWTFSILQAVLMGCFGLSASNFNAMAMEPMGAIAGTAASIQGFVSTVGGTLIGAVVGQSFDGTTVPVSLGYVVLGVLTLLAVFITERGRLFRPQCAPVSTQ
jgi:DHA1 family bicyclomycin/chloramphenicol resistance-like MFS transporter